MILLAALSTTVVLLTHPQMPECEVVSPSTINGQSMLMEGMRSENVEINFIGYKINRSLMQLIEAYRTNGVRVNVLSPTQYKKYKKVPFVTGSNWAVIGTFNDSEDIDTLIRGDCEQVKLFKKAAEYVLEKER